MGKINIWRDDNVSISTLNLDLENPRVPKHVKEHKSEAQIRNYLLAREDVLRVAKSIANNGYHKSAISIVCEENEKMVVLDGNRRLAACQLLLKPELAPNAKEKKELELLKKTVNKKELENIKITIAPSRKEAEKEIWDIHVNRLLKSWEKLQRLRMYKNLIDEEEFDLASAAKQYGTTKGKFTEELAKLYFYEWILENGASGVEDKMREAGFNAIERLITSKNGQKLLKYKVSGEGLVSFHNQKKSEKHLKMLIPYIIGDKKISAQATQDNLIDDVYSKIDPSNFSKKKITRKKKEASKKILRPPKYKERSFKELALQSRRNSRSYSLIDAARIVDYVLVHFDVVAEQLLERHDGRGTIKIEDEYDAQDLLHALLAMFFDDVASEEVNPSGGAASSRSDFLLLDNGTIIEVKTTLTRAGNDKIIRKKLEEELNDDLMKYSRRSDCKRIYFFVYDPEKKIKKHTTFERGVSSNKLKNIEVKVIVNRT